MNNNRTILSVAEKPSVAKELANIISNNQRFNTRNSHSVYNKIFEIPSCSFMGQANYSMKMTSVRGHLLDIDFDPKYKVWHDCQPIELFTAPIQKLVKHDCKDIERTLIEESKNCSILLLWLDCDLEGENIAYEVIQICIASNPHLNVYRARFSALIPRDIFRTLQYPDRPNIHFNHAVEARQEIDLRLGAAFTRFQTKRLQSKFESLSSAVISYGPCQFPTLGFVVDRYLQIQKFQPEAYWSITADYEWSENTNNNGNNTVNNSNNPHHHHHTSRYNKEKQTCHFRWERGCVYDHFTALLLYENCLNLNNIPTPVTNTACTITNTNNNNGNNGNGGTNESTNPDNNNDNNTILTTTTNSTSANTAPLNLPSNQQQQQPQQQQQQPLLAQVIKCDNRPTSRYRPCPLNTIELQKRASRFLHLASDRTMTIAEALYQRGILSYPRTETDFFKEGTDLLSLVHEQCRHSLWGDYATSLLLPQTVNPTGAGVNNNNNNNNHNLNNIGQENDMMIDDNNNNNNNNHNNDQFQNPPPPLPLPQYQANPAKFEWPKNGGHDDQAHPPIHPLKCIELNEFNDELEKAVYELVTRHFLACCSQDGRGHLTTITVQIPASTNSSNSTTAVAVGNFTAMPSEIFTTSGLMIVERNWLDVYGRFEKWSANKVPLFQVGDTFSPSSVLLVAHKTCPPLPISESDLITDMDKNGIGTDATIATHIATIQQREYVMKVNSHNPGVGNNNNPGVGNNNNPGVGNDQNGGGTCFIPTKLGLALIEAYNEMGYQLNKPFLRASMEKDCQRIAKGELDKNTVVRNVLQQMKQCYETCFQEAYKLDLAVAKHFNKLGMDESATYRTIQRQLSTCGVCRHKMDLRIKHNAAATATATHNDGDDGDAGERGSGARGGRGGVRGRGRGRGRGRINASKAIGNNNPNNANHHQVNRMDEDNENDDDDDDDEDNINNILPIPENVPRHLYCATCRKAHLLPPKGELSPHTHICPICQFQVLNVRNIDTNKEHTLCPHCFATPPPVPISDLNTSQSNDFRCMSCAHTECILAGRTMGNDINILLCPENTCRSNNYMKLKKSKSGGYMLACTDSVRCKRIWWFPKCMKSVIPVMSETTAGGGTGGSTVTCTQCMQLSHGRSLIVKLKCTVALSLAPPGTPPEITVCVCCDRIWKDMNQEPLKRKAAAPATTHNILQPPPPPQQQQQQQQPYLQINQAIPHNHYHQPQQQQLLPPHHPSPYLPQQQQCNHNHHNSNNNHNQSQQLQPHQIIATNSSSLTTPSSSSSSSLPLSTPPVVMCQCNMPSKLITVAKEGPNKGRQFYTCSNRNEQAKCKFFLWYDELMMKKSSSSSSFNTQPQPQQQQRRFNNTHNNNSGW